MAMSRPVSHLYLAGPNLDSCRYSLRANPIYLMRYVPAIEKLPPILVYIYRRDSFFVATSPILIIISVIAIIAYLLVGTEQVVSVESYDHRGKVGCELLLLPVSSQVFQDFAIGQVIPVFIGICNGEDRPTSDVQAYESDRLLTQEALSHWQIQSGLRQTTS